MACFTAATLAALTTGVFATVSSIFCMDLAELVSVTVSPVREVVAAPADPSLCDLSAATLLLFEPLMGATGSAAEYALILSVTEISPGAKHRPMPRYRQGLDELSPLGLK